MRRMSLITYLDDASRCVTGTTLFRKATLKNAVTVLRQAMNRFGMLTTILSDNGSCFVGACGRNIDRLHWELDTDNYEAPMIAFRNKTATDDIRSQNPKWMEANVNG